MSTKAINKEAVGGSTYLMRWEALANGDDGAPAQFFGAADRTVQVDGVFGAGGAVVLEGSINGTDYHTLTDPQGNALTFTSARLETVMELVRYIRPRVTNGDGSTALNVTLLMKE